MTRENTTDKGTRRYTGERTQEYITNKGKYKRQGDTYKEKGYREREGLRRKVQG